MLAINLLEHVLMIKILHKKVNKKLLSPNKLKNWIFNYDF